MRYLVHYEGSGEGCDYTIGCNHAISFVNADDLPSAVDKVVDSLLAYPDGESSYYDPDRLDKVTIYAVPEVTGFDLEGIKNARQAMKEAETKRRQETRDRIQYEALKVRFEKSSR